jgi:hypothetical protein
MFQGLAENGYIVYEVSVFANQKMIDMFLLVESNSPYFRGESSARSLL